MSPLYPSLEEITEDLFDKVVAVNLKGPFRLAALVGSRMAKGKGGAILNVSSTAAVRPSPGAEPYGAAKAGLNALTRSLAFAYGPKVRVNCIMAGPFFTDVSKHWDMEAFKQRASTNLASSAVVIPRRSSVPRCICAVMRRVSPAAVCWRSTAAVTSRTKHCERLSDRWRRDGRAGRGRPYGGPARAKRSALSSVRAPALPLAAITTASRSQYRRSLQSSPYRAPPPRVSPIAPSPTRLRTRRNFSISPSPQWARTDTDIARLS